MNGRAILHRHPWLWLIPAAGWLYVSNGALLPLAMGLLFAWLAGFAFGDKPLREAEL